MNLYTPLEPITLIDGSLVHDVTVTLGWQDSNCRDFPRQFHDIIKSFRFKKMIKPTRELHGSHDDNNNQVHGQIIYSNSLFQKHVVDSPFMWQACVCICHRYVLYVIGMCFGMHAIIVAIDHHFVTCMWFYSPFRRLFWHACRYICHWDVILWPACEYFGQCDVIFVACMRLYLLLRRHLCIVTCNNVRKE